MPSADSTPACRGTITVAMSSCSAISQACMPPAPPNASSANSRGIVAALDRHHADRALHVGVGDADDAFGQLAHGQLQRLRKSARPRARVRARSSDIRPPRKYSGIETAEQQVRIRDRQFRADAVAHRTGRRAGTPRSDAQARRRCRRTRSIRRRRRPCGCRSPAAARESRRPSNRSSCGSRRQSD